ncbi:LptF/LptG family permease [Psychrobacter sp.]|uniref:LptF/LptG family permease n=1 Tax=Psychrobacter sp. TaxID=56811 RepID=UPI0025EAA68A|nr:LptF/LptG family permease [Psychrobacter sp.]
MTRQVASTTALVLGFLVVLLLGGRMIRYFGIAAEGRLDVGLLFAIIGYNLPFFLELVLPLSFFIGLMLVFGRLYVDNEMAVLNGSGISRGSLARLMIPFILLLFVIEAGLSLYGKPWGVRNSDSIWHQQSLSSAFDLIRPQSFITSDNYHLYVGGMNEDRTELRDVILVQTGDESNDNKKSDLANSSQNEQDQAPIAEKTVPNLTPKADKTITELTKPVAPTDTQAESDSADRDVIVLAKRAVQVVGSSNSNSTQLDLFQGRRYEVGADSLVYNQISFERYRISINQPPKDIITDENVATQTLPVLWQAATGQAAPVIDLTKKASTDKPATIQKPDQKQVNAAQAELGYRLSLPWLIILAPMLAVPLAQVRPRQGRWLRLLPAIIIFASCAIVIISLKNSVTKGSLSVLSYPIAIISFIALALYLNWASRIHHRVRFRLGQRKLSSLNDSMNNGGQQ